MAHLSPALLLLPRLLPPLADVAVFEVVDEEVGRAHERQEHVAAKTWYFNSPNKLVCA